MLQLVAYIWCRNYGASIVICQLKTLGYDAGVIFMTLMNFHNIECYGAIIVINDIVFFSYKPLSLLSHFNKL